MRIAVSLLFFISLFGIAHVKADDRFGTIGRFSVEANYQFGRIVPHNSRFTAPITGYTNSFELSFYKQTLGEKAWQRKLHYPEVGGSFVLAHNHDQQLFGNAYMLLAVAKFWIVRSRYVDFYFRVGTGLTYVTRKFDRVDNPLNTVIGSHINSADQFRLGVDFKPSAYVHITLGINFTHYSNASAQKPNIGINVPAMSVGVRYFPVVSKNLSYNRSKVPKPGKKNEVMLRLSFGYAEMQATGGPKYPIYIGTVNYARYTSVANKVLAGASAEFSQGDYDFGVIQEIDPKHNRTLDAMKISLFAGDEILMGRVGLLFAAGGYVFNPVKGVPVYAKLGLNYYLPDFGRNKTSRFFIGVSMKTHFMIAQYYETGLGVAF